MAKATKVIKVDDVDYTITQIGGVEGLDLWDRLTRELGPNVIEGVRQALIKGEKGSEELVAVIVVRALVSLPSDVKRDMRTKFARLTTIDTGSVQLRLCEPDRQLQPEDTFDQHFAGRFPHMERWLVAAMKWGFAGFLPASGSSDAKTTPTPTASQ